jgi:hypothetical protein
VIGLLEGARDGPDRTGADGPVVDFANPDYFRGGPGHEDLVGQV